MNRSALFLLLAVVAVAGLLFAVDPLGMFGKSGDDDGGDGTAIDSLEGDGPKLQGTGKGIDRQLAETEYEGDPVGVLDLGLGGSSLTGLVTDGSAPLPRARVRVSVPPPHHELGVRTRDDGTYEIKGLPAGQFDLHGTAEGYIGRTVTAPSLGAEDAAEAPVIELDKHPGKRDSLRVSVIDPYGRPVPGARVLASTMSWDIHIAMGPELTGTPDVRSASATTNEKGEATFRGLDPDRYDVAVSASGYQTRGVSEVVVAEGRSRSLSVQLQPAVTLRGTVVDREGRPVEGATVMGFHTPSFASSLSVTTDKNGNFELTDLRPGGYMLMGYHESGGQVQGRGTAPGNAQPLKLGGTATVKGRVVDTAGEPVANAQIRPWRAQPFGYATSMVERSGADGSFSFRVPQGTYTLYVQGEGGSLSSDTRVSLKPGDTKEIEVKLPSSYVVRGVVVDPDGRHIQGAEVYVRRGEFPPGPTREQYARTDAEGRFEVPGLTSDPVNLHVRHPSFGNTTFEATPAPKSTATEKRVQMDRGGFVHGYVKDVDGDPIAGEQINLFKNWFEPLTTYTNAQGYYRFDAVAPGGGWNLTTGIFENGAPGQSRTNQTVTAEGLQVDFTTEPGDGEVSGTVYLGGKPVVGAEVMVMDIRGQGSAVSVKTDEAGKYLVQGLKPGSVTIRVTTTEGISTTKVRTIPEAEKSLVADITMGTASVTCKAIDEEGVAVSGVWVSVEATQGDGGWGNIRASTNADQGGIIRASGLEPGRYILRLSSATHAQVVTEPFELADGQAADLGTITLRSGAVITGRVTNDEGRPVEDATISVKDSQGRPVFLFSLSTTGSDGRFSVRGLEPGSYTVRAEAKAHAPADKRVTLTDGGAEVALTIQRGGRLIVQVQNVGGDPIAEAAVRLQDSKGNAVTRTLSLVNLFEAGTPRTNAQGSATISDLAAGAYRVLVERAGYVVSGEAPRVTVSAGGAATVTVVLEESSGN